MELFENASSYSSDIRENSVKQFIIRHNRLESYTRVLEVNVIFERKLVESKHVGGFRERCLFVINKSQLLLIKIRSTHVQSVCECGGEICLLNHIWQINQSKYFERKY